MGSPENLALHLKDSMHQTNEESESEISLTSIRIQSASPFLTPDSEKCPEGSDVFDTIGESTCKELGEDQMISEDGSQDIVFMNNNVKSSARITRSSLKAKIK